MKNENISKWTGQRIRSFMHEKDIRPKELAAKTSIHVKTIYAYRLGRIEPPLAITKKICKAFGITIDEFLEGSPEAILHH